MELDAFQKSFDTIFSIYIEKKILSVQQYFPDDSSFDVISYLREYTKAWKRFRPYMVYIWYKLYGGNNDEWIMRVGIIYELIHTFALIHDDICDQWLMRRHVSAYHKHVGHMYENPHAGDAQAIIMWDLVYTWAIELVYILLSEYPESQRMVLDMLEQVMCGQILDIHFSHEVMQRNDEEIAMKDYLKSWQYTFEKPLVCGALLWWVSNSELDILSWLGKSMWIAFQMRDDLLDRLPNKEGKTSYSDIREGNQTIVTSLLYAALSDEERIVYASLRWDEHLAPIDIQQILSWLEMYSIQEAVSTSLQKYLDVAADLVKKIWWSDVYKAYVYTIISVLQKI